MPGPRFALGWIAALIVGGLPPLVAISAPAKGLLSLQQGAGQLGSRYEGNWSGTPTHKSTSSSSLSEWLTLPFSGDILDSRILNYTLVLRPTFSHRDATDLSKSIQSRALDLNLGARAMSSTPLRFALDWSKSTGSVSGGFGTQSQFASSSLAGAVSYQNPWLPGSVRLTRRRAANMSTVGLDMVPLEQSYKTDEIRISASNSRTALNFGSIDHRDRLRPGASYRSSNLNVNHGLRWGKGSSLDSSYEGLNRRTRSPNTRHAWKERLRLQHFRSVSTTWSHSYATSNNGAGSFNTRSLSGNLDSRFSRNLRVGLNAGANAINTPSGRNRTRTLTPRATMQIGLPLRTRLTGSASLGFQERSRDGTAGTISVIEEPFRFDPSGTLILEETDVNPASIVLIDSDKTTIFEPEIDYRVFVTGERVEIRVLPGGRIRFGDVVLVSFQFQGEFSETQSAVVSRYSATLRIGTLSLQHSRSRRSTDVSDLAAPGGLSEFDETTTHLRTVHDLPKGNLRIDLTRRERLSLRRNQTTHEAHASAVMRATRRLQIETGAGGRITEELQTVVRSASGRAAGIWRINGHLLVKAELLYRIWSDDVQPTERSYGGVGDVSWRFGSMDTGLRYVFDRHEFQTKRSGHRVNLRVTRFF